MHGTTVKIIVSAFRTVVSRIFMSVNNIRCPGVKHDITGNYCPYDKLYRCADKSLARPTSRCILFDGENISSDASLVIYINSTNIPPIIIINRIYETQNLLSL
jgi:hypothetical protein